MDAVAQQINGGTCFFLQVAFDGANGLGKIHISQNIVKPDDGKILIKAAPVATASPWV